MDELIKINTKSEKYLEARDSLPENLWPAYEKLVIDYHFYTTKNFGRGYVAYKVLADLIRAGLYLKESQ